MGFAELVIGPATSVRTRWLNPFYELTGVNRIRRRPSSAAAVGPTIHWPAVVKGTCTLDKAATINWR